MNNLLMSKTITTLFLLFNVFLSEAQPIIIITNPPAVCSPNTVDLTDPTIISGSKPGATTTAAAEYTYWMDSLATVSVKNPSMVSISGTYYIKQRYYEVIEPVIVTINNCNTINLISPWVTNNGGKSTCVNTSMSPIIYVTTVATGAELVPHDSLPQGIQGVWKKDTMIVSGILTEVGVFRYRINTTGGVGSASAEGAISVVNCTSATLNILDPDPVCSPSTVDITKSYITAGSASGITSLTYWSDTLATIPLTNPSAIAVTGTYYIKSVGGSDSDIKQVNVTVNPSVNISIKNPSTVCAPQTVDITSATTNLSGGILSYWSDSICTLSISNPSLISSTGTFYIKSSLENCFDVKPVNVVINSSPNLQISNPQAVCSPSTVDITSHQTINGGLLTYWKDAACFTALTSPSLIADSGTYYIKSTLGNCTEVKPVSVIINNCTILNTINLTSSKGSNYQTINLNDSINKIIYVTTGATGATFTGLPNGVSGAWNSNEIIISGKPSEIGTFNFTINLIGGGGNINTDGIIVVNQVSYNFFDFTNYRGAFAPSPTNPWTDGWVNWNPQNTDYGTSNKIIAQNITSDTYWSNDSIYLLQGPIYVKNGATLTIQEGAKILGDKNTPASMLIVTKGSKLKALGTANQPIIFSSNQSIGAKSLGDWGGIVLLGKASTNYVGGIGYIEGIAPSAETEFGGGTAPNDLDNSGEMHYVRIEFGGYALAPDKEFNGLTLAAVGNLTSIDHVQISYTNDDAVEWFGGTVNCKYLVSYRNLDDDFDTDFGYSGKVQYALSVRDPQIADNPSVSTSEGFESDNNSIGSNETPQTSAIFSNCTMVGPLRGNSTSSIATGYRRGARIRRNSGLKIYNTIFMDHLRGVHIDGVTCEKNATNGVLKLKNNIFAGNSNGLVCETTLVGTAPNQTASSFNILAWFTTNSNDSLVSTQGILERPYDYLNPDYRPASSSIALQNINHELNNVNDTVIKQVITLNISNPPNVCSPSTVNLTSSSITLGSINAISFSYWRDSLATISLVNPTSISESGIYYIKAINTSDSLIKPVLVSITVTPEITLSAQIKVACGSYELPIITGVNLSGNQKYYNNTQALGGTPITSPITTGVQNVWIYDAQGTCSDEKSLQVWINPLPKIKITEQKVLAQGKCDGTIQATILDSIGYHFKWAYNSDSTNLNQTGLCAGVYKITVTSKEGCVKDTIGKVGITAPTNPCVNSTLMVSTSTVQLTGPNSDDGKIISTVSGGVSPYRYNWSNGAKSATIESLKHDTYRLIVTDAQGCSIISTGIIANYVAKNVVVPLKAYVITSGETASSSCDGSASTIASGGVLPYTYLHSNGTTSSSVSYLCQGVYDVKVIDANHDSIVVNYIITSPSNTIVNTPITATIQVVDSCYATLIKNCTIDIDNIDSAYIVGFSMIGKNSISVQWKVVDANGIINKLTNKYSLSDSVGVFQFSLQLYCPTKSTGRFLTAYDQLNITQEGSGSLGLGKVDIKTVGIYPNPFRDYIIISLDNIESSEVLITDIAGKEVVNKKFNDKLIKIDMNAFSSGSYIVTVRNNNTVTTKQIVK